MIYAWICRDEGVNWGIQNGLYLSRSKVKMFKHNDMKDLESLLEEVRKEDLRKKKALNRRFIVVEAIYQVNFGKTILFLVCLFVCFCSMFGYFCRSILRFLGLGHFTLEIEGL